MRYRDATCPVKHAYAIITCRCLPRMGRWHECNSRWNAPAPERGRAWPACSFLFCFVSSMLQVALRFASRSHSGGKASKPAPKPGFQPGSFNDLLARANACPAPRRRARVAQGCASETHGFGNRAAPLLSACAQRAQEADFPDSACQAHAIRSNEQHPLRDSSPQSSD